MDTHLQNLKDLENLIDAELLRKKFERLGARVKLSVRPLRAAAGRVAVDVRSDGKGEYFDIALAPGRAVRLDAVDVRPRNRHLLLMAAEDEPGDSAWSGAKHKFLCGHDERAWFVAAVPGSAGAGNVPAAMEALKPRAVRDSQAHHHVPARKRNRRKNRGFVRQGEWFFVPDSRLRVNEAEVTTREPLQRTGGKAHWAEFAYREGGQAVYVSDRYPAGLTPTQYRRHVRRHPEQGAQFQLMRRNARVYVTGRISHPDHKTILLRGWHRVEMNTEHESQAMRHVAFLD
jgi:hypothetical protein